MVVRLRISCTGRDEKKEDRVRNRSASTGTHRALSGDAILPEFQFNVEKRAPILERNQAALVIPNEMCRMECTERKINEVERSFVERQAKNTRN